MVRLPVVHVPQPIGARPARASADTGNSSSVRAVALDVASEDWLEYVNRDKAGVIVGFVEENQAAARRALGGRRLPRGFSATSYGVLLPKRKRS